MDFKSMALNKCFNVFLKQKRKYRDLLCWTIFFTFTFLYGCAPRMLERKLTVPTQFQSLDSNSPFLKAHMHDGKAYILSSWKVDSENQTVTGQGEVLNVNREILETGEFTILVDSVLVFETNILQPPPKVVRPQDEWMAFIALSCAYAVAVVVIGPYMRGGFWSG